MLRTAVKGMWAHKLRLTLTALSIILGVAFVVGSFVFTDTIQDGFDKLFGDAYAGVGVQVEAEVLDFAQQGEDVPSFDEGVLDGIASVPGVKVAVPSVRGFAQLLDSEGELLGISGPPKFAFSWVEHPTVNRLTILEADGRPPTGPGEVAVDIETATRHDITVGQEVDVAFENGKGRFEVVGLATSVSQTDFGSSSILLFEHREAQRLLRLEGQLTAIVVQADEGVSPETLLESIEAVLPDGLMAATGEELKESVVEELETSLGFFNTALLVFAGVAILVGAFIIQNTFRIIVAQRLRELALLRAIGATSRQIVRMVATEAALVGLVASALGVGAGILLAYGMREALGLIGFTFPRGDLVVETRTIVLGMVVGVVITVVSALLPAFKASSVPPVAALQAGAGHTKRASLRNRAIIGFSVTGLGIVGLVVGLVWLGITYVGVGALLLFLGVAILAPLVARPAGSLLGSPLPRLFGLPGLLAKENTRRQPRRTAATASALMIGIALVSFVAVLSSSISESVKQSLLETFAADLTITSLNFNTGVSGDFVEDLDELEDLAAVSSVRVGQVQITTGDPSDEITTNIAAIDPATVEQVWSTGAEPGVDAVVEGMIVETSQMDERGWAVGDILTLKFPSGDITELEITGTLASEAFGGILISEQRYLTHYELNAPALVLVATAEGVELDAARQQVQDLASDYPLVQVQTKSEFAADFENQIGQLVAVFNGLLALAIVIAILGITNTLALSITERIREIGLLRAVGMVRRQIRRMVRWEAVVVAVFGAVLGVLLGGILGWAVRLALADDGLEVFNLPALQLVVYVALAGVAGVIAAILPARSASRIKILDAIAYE
ncbi:MAG: FtsX-like permease family protein [bacterium]|nr:ABC transporter permease [Acidimicrobiia bacterium]MCY4650534.1 FtsX-like permease family protein [bacterium]